MIIPQRLTRVLIALAPLRNGNRSASAQNDAFRALAQLREIRQDLQALENEIQNLLTDDRPLDDLFQTFLADFDKE